MKVTITERELWRMREYAQDEFMARHNTAIDGQLYSLYCHIKALEMYLNQQGHNVAFELPEKSQIETIDDI